MMYKCGVIYKVDCSRCDGFYIGETGRPLNVRIDEHEKSAKEGNLKSALSEHQLNEGYKIDFESTKVIQQVQEKGSRKVAEAIQIRIHKPTLNRDQGYDLPRVYNQILGGGAGQFQLLAQCQTTLTLVNHNTADDECRLHLKASEM
jgi:hypothetical protein